MIRDGAFMRGPDKHTAATELAEAFERAGQALPEMRFAYLFGSAATGIMRPDSDVDVAVDCGRPLGLDDYAAITEISGTPQRRGGHARLRRELEPWILVGVPTIDATRVSPQQGRDDPRRCPRLRS